MRTFINRISILSDTQQSSIVYFASLEPNKRALFYILISFSLTLAAALPIVKVKTSVHSEGFINSAQQDIEVKSLVSSIIDSVYVKENQFVHKNDLLVRMQKTDIANKSRIVQERVNLSQQIDDVKSIIAASVVDKTLLIQLRTPEYRHRLMQYLEKVEEFDVDYRILEHELQRLNYDNNRFLTSKSQYDSLQKEKLRKGLVEFKNSQRITWISELRRLENELLALGAQSENHSDEIRLYSVKAPVDGYVGNIDAIAGGNSIHQGENVCVITQPSPLVIHCYIKPEDRYFIKVKQKVIVHLPDIGSGTERKFYSSVKSIDNIPIVKDGRFIYHATCSLPDKNLFDKNTIKGVTVKINFFVGEATLWEMLANRINKNLNISI